MKRILSIVAALLCATSIYAQTIVTEDYSSLEPGLYAVMEDGLKQMSPEVGGTVSNFGDTDANTDFDIILCRFRYKGIHSVNGVLPGKFILVRDPEKIGMTQVLKKYNPFYKNLTPDNMMLISFGYYRRGREFSGDRHIREGINIIFDHIDFEWQQLSDDVFEIDATGLPFGEYGFVFRISDLASFKFDASYTFSRE